MRKDSLISWEDGFPYDLLAPAGIHPASTMQEIRDASFSLMAQGAMTPEIRNAWDTLRRSERRLAVDFFICETEQPVEPAPAGAERRP
jgi:hypothetical protein